MKKLFLLLSIAALLPAFVTAMDDEDYGDFPVFLKYVIPGVPPAQAELTTVYMDKGQPLSTAIAELLSRKNVLNRFSNPFIVILFNHMSYQIAQCNNIVIGSTPEGQTTLEGLYTRDNHNVNLPGYSNEQLITSAPPIDSPAEEYLAATVDAPSVVTENNPIVVMDPLIDN